MNDLLINLSNKIKDMHGHYYHPRKPRTIGIYGIIKEKLEKHDLRSKT